MKGGFIKKQRETFWFIRNNLFYNSLIINTPYNFKIRL